MVSLMLRQLRQRMARVAVLFAAIAVAAASFALLTSTAATSRLQVTGTVSGALRPAYDLLVRPHGARLPTETQLGLVQPSYLSGQYGGITVAQWEKIKQLDEIGVAAPVAMIGYGMTSLPVPVDLARHVAAPGREVLRVDSTWTSDRAMTDVSEPRRYLYATDQPLTGATRDSGGADGTYETLPDGTRRLVCSGAPSQRGPSAAPQERLKCWSPQMQGARGDTAAQWSYGWIYPYLLVGIDPEQEALLTGLDTAVVTGRRLTGTDAPQDATSAETAYRTVPVMLASQPSLDRDLAYRVTRLPDGAADQVLNGATQPELMAGWKDLPGAPVAEGTVSAATAYQKLITQLSDPEPSVGRRLLEYFTVGQVQYRQQPDGTLVPVEVDVDRKAVWNNTANASSEGTVGMPEEAADPMFRQPSVHTALQAEGAPAMGSAVLAVVGTYDASRLPQQNALSTVPMETYTAAQAVGADQRSRDLLGGRDLLPNANIGGLLTSAATMLTPLSSLSVLHDPQRYSDIAPEQAAAPISVIRVRLSGDIGLDDLSQERLRVAAEEIATATGLDVDIMVGSSSSSRAVALPAGDHGRPDLLLSQSWVNKGVATVIVRAVDRKSVVLFGLILVVAAIVVGNATAASVRNRRTELAVLACTGWARKHLVRLILGELFLIGVLAGIAGLVLALLAAAALNQQVPLWWLAVTLPAAVALTLLAGLSPALRAGRADPGSAVRPEVVLSKGTGSIRSIRSLAVAYLVRVPGRTLLGICTLMIGVAALTMLIAVTTVFRGAVTGTVLGEAVTVQARAADYIGIALTIGFAGFAIADILYLNIRDTGAELATLRAVGWSDAQLARLVGYQAFGIGLVGSILGAGLGAGLTWALVGAVPAPLLQAALLTGLGGCLVATFAGALPMLAIQRLPTAQLLTEE